jgi:hypothetical protein
METSLVRRGTYGKAVLPTAQRPAYEVEQEVKVYVAADLTDNQPASPPKYKRLDMVKLTPEGAIHFSSKVNVEAEPLVVFIGFDRTYERHGERNYQVHEGLDMPMCLIPESLIAGLV